MSSDAARRIEEKLREADDLLDAVDLMMEDDRHAIESHLNRMAADVRSIPTPDPGYMQN
jgi:hypothetical protein